MSEKGRRVVLSRGRTIALAICVGGGDYSTVTLTMVLRRRIGHIYRLKHLIAIGHKCLHNFSNIDEFSAKVPSLEVCSFRDVIVP
jgi:hypothetical protein